MCVNYVARSCNMSTDIYCMEMHDRLIKERERLGFNQDQMAAAGGMKKRAYCYYESGERAPDAVFLAGVAKLGADVRYIITGQRDAPPPEVLSADERELLALFRTAPLAVKAAAIGALQGGSAPKQKIQKQLNVSVGNNHGQMAEKIVNKKT